MKVPKITVDAAQCGAGKTTQYIIPRISQNLSSGINTLVVLPSIEMCNRYKEQFSIATKIISNQDDNRTTRDKLTEAMERLDKLIIITHQTFLKVSDLPNRNNYYLIIDEQFDAYDMASIMTFSGFKSLFDSWFRSRYKENQYCFQVDKEKVGAIPHEYIKLRTKYDFKTNSSELFNKEIINSITNPNYDYFISHDDWVKLLDNKRFELKIFKILNKDLFIGWDGIHIAAADFDETKTGVVFRSQQIKYQIIRKFEPHDVNILGYSIKDVRWSKYKLNTYPGLQSSYKDLVNKHRGSGHMLSLRNNDNKTTFDREYVLPHNNHGLNQIEYQDCTDISIESAINPDPALSRFLKHYVLEKCGITDRYREDWIRKIHSDNLMYQTIMRSCIRNYDNQLVRLFTYDSDVLVGQLAHYFKSINQEQIIELDIDFKSNPNKFK